MRTAVFDIPSRSFDGIRARPVRARVRSIASPAMDYELPPYLRQPTPFALERRAAKKAARAVLMRDILSAGVMIAAIVLTGVLAAMSAVPQPPDAHAQELVPVAPQKAPSAPEAPAPEHPAGSAVYATVTAYSSSPDETDDTPFITADGSHVTRGTLACPSRYEFGQKVLIDGEIYTCQDRMAARYRNLEHFDIWMPSKAAALAYGTKQITITIL